MDISTAIRTRRSNGYVFPDKPVERTAIERILQAGCWAPNHKRTEPWRFSVFMGEGRKGLAAAMVEGAKAADKDSPEKMFDKAFRAPVVIAVWAAVGRNLHKNPPMWEDHAAVAAACQNMLLETHAQGLAGFWKSGDVVEWPAVHELLGMETEKGDRILGFLYIGHPDKEAGEPLRPEPKWQEKTTWVLTA